MIQPPLGLLTHLVALRSALDEQRAARANEPVVHRDSLTHVKLELLPYAVSEMWHAFTSFICATHRLAAHWTRIFRSIRSAFVFQMAIETSSPTRSTRS